MDAFVKKLERLAELASARPVPRPLDAAGVMARIRDLEREDSRVLSLPMGFFAGGAGLAAAAALAVSLLAASAWNDMGNPLLAIESMVDFTEFL